VSVGSYYYINGDKYEGQMKNNKKEGEGTMYYADGGTYEGTWKNDMRNASGN